MSSMTIDQLKKSLTEQGITLPPSRSKKADYLKLYQQYSTINDSLGDVYASDDENPPKTGSQSVSSSTSPGKADSIAKDVELMSDDELYNQLKEYDTNIGPVLKNTRRVYEKKLIKILSSNKDVNNYVEKNNTENSGLLAEEFSDSDVEIITKSPKKIETKPRKTSVLRDSPKPSSPESLKSDIEKPFLGSFEYTNRSSTPTYSNETKASRYSYVETVPKGPKSGFLEHGPEGDGGSNLRQRYTEKYGTHKFNLDTLGSNRFSANKGDGDDLYKGTTNADIYKPDLTSQFSFGMGSDKYKPGFTSTSQYKSTLGLSNKSKLASSGRDQYIGSWEPNVNRYLGTGTQKRSSSKSQHYSLWFKNLFAGLLLLFVLLLIAYLYQQWAATDPYKMIEDDAERTIQEFSQGSGAGN